MVKTRFLAALFLLSSTCLADAIYNFSIDTTNQSGNLGAIYFQFQGGLNADPASILISNFVIGGSGSLDPLPLFTDGGVTGALNNPPLIIDNSGGLNDYLHGLVYGSFMSFSVEFLFPSPLTGSSGSELIWQLTASDGITPVLTADNVNGYMGRIAYDTAGRFTIDTLGNDAIQSVTVSTPEPRSLFMLLIPLAALWRRFRR